MTDSMREAESVGRRYAVLRRHLDERQRRLLLGSEAAELGRGGIKAVAEATGAHPDTVARGGSGAGGRPGARCSGAGRWRWPEEVVRVRSDVDRSRFGGHMD